MANISCILYESLIKGEYVHSKDGSVFMLTEDKKWNDKTFSGVIIYGPKEDIGVYDPKWCADVFFKFN